MKLNPIYIITILALSYPSSTMASEITSSSYVELVFVLNSLLFLVSGFLVFWMAAGFTMLEAGLVRSKNVTMQLTKNMSLFSLACVFYYLIGYKLMYPGDSWAIQGILGSFGATELEPVGV